MEIDIRLAQPGDVEELAQMNLQLNRDERDGMAWTPEIMEKRMRDWLVGSEHTVLIIETDGQVGGFAVFHEEPDEYLPVRACVYVSHFFIKKQYRMNQLGRRAFEMIAEQYFPDGVKIGLSVLETNPEGRAFWEKLGFKPYNTRFYRRKKS